jgi:hypothetical protein
MKIPALVTILALACGGAVAGGNSSASADHQSGKAHASAAAGDHQAKKSGDGIVDKTKRGFQRMGEKLGKWTRTGNPNDRAHEQAMGSDARSDTRSMGAAGSDSHDSSRRQRMDDAYANWQSQQKKQER